MNPMRLQPCQILNKGKMIPESGKTSTSFQTAGDALPPPSYEDMEFEIIRELLRQYKILAILNRELKQARNHMVNLETRIFALEEKLGKARSPSKYD